MRNQKNCQQEIIEFFLLNSCYQRDKISVGEQVLKKNEKLEFVW